MIPSLGLVASISGPNMAHQTAIFAAWKHCPLKYLTRARNITASKLSHSSRMNSVSVDEIFGRVAAQGLWMTL